MREVTAASPDSPRRGFAGGSREWFLEGLEAHRLALIRARRALAEGEPGAADAIRKLARELETGARDHGAAEIAQCAAELLGPGRDGRTIEPEGIKGSALTADQQALLLDVIAAWVNIVEPATARARMEEIKGTLADTSFSWRGPTAKGSAAYFRVHGPTIVIEYAPQGGTDHIHTVVRNPKDDYGAGVLKK